ncbi:hypothetical protein [Mucilaginibacter gilvus]|uniref:Uncharacterized protein n=1 Tax=Mucilaginibacter gilvus TaxID=2305909 RepID=A0A444MQQ4_9SPHI|nr:hypothetical protein [Mucilaginibacter gilvus]RWY53956.1 hypothetical protein EPL05_07825 [Mucilaginibacter gilvus]
MSKKLDITELQFNHLNHGHYLRGLLINEFSGLEKKIERFIVTYFLGDSNMQNEMSDVLLDRLTFEAKRASFKSIIDKRSVKNGFKKSKNNKYPESALFDEIRRLNDHRIYFAHYIMVMPSTIDENIIGLAEFRDSVKILWYSEKEYQKLIADINRVSDKIELMIEDLKST